MGIYVGLACIPRLCEWVRASAGVSLRSSSDTTPCIQRVGEGSRYKKKIAYAHAPSRLMNITVIKRPH
jgi:hypothetical protein